MTEEIKEMLWKIKRQNTYDDIGYFKTPLSNDDADKLLNYITNLQKENEKYKSSNKKTIELLKSLQEKYGYILEDVIFLLLQGGDE